MESARRTVLPRPRVAVCHLLHTLSVGGAEVLAARLARRLGDTVRFVFVCLDGLGSLGCDLRGEGFTVEVLQRRAGMDWNLPRRVADMLRRHRVDLVHAHQYTPFFYALLARWCYRRLPVLFTEHGRQFPDHPRKKRILANRLLLQRGDRVIGVGQAVRQALIDNEAIPADRVGVIYNGVDLAAVANEADNRPVVRRELGLSDKHLLILQVARLDYLKDHATAIQTMRHVLPRCPDARLVLVGEGSERASIEALVHQHGLASQVMFLGLRRDVARLLSAADVFLLTSISEGIPLTIIEAMAAGLPVVSTRVGGIPEMFDDGQVGFFAAPGDAASLADKIIRLASDPKLRQTMGEHGREHCWHRFSEQQMHAQYERLYQEMVHV